MVEAARTMASTAGTWAIVIVAVVALAFWLGGIFVADHMQVRASGRSRAATWPSYTGTSTPGSVAGEQATEISEQGEPEQRTQEQAPAAETPAPSMPRQRTGEGDRAERSYAGQRSPDEEDPGR
jgi:hypothetical protein